MRCMLFLLLAFAIACQSPTPSSETVSAPTPVHNNGVTIAYSDTGRADTTLLFVHGWCINKSYWEAQVAHFAAHYRVVTIDLPGFGDSGKNRDKWDTQTFAQDIDSVIAQLGLKNVVLIGHSMAGDIVLQSATNNPGKVIGIVGVDNFKTVGRPFTKEDSAMYAKVIQEMKRDFKGTVMPYFGKELFSSTTPAAVKARVNQDVERADTVIAVAAMAAAPIDEGATLKTWGKALYLVNSDVIPTDTTWLAANHIPFHIEYTPGTGHYSMIENAAAFNEKLENILRLIGKEK